MTGAQWVGLVIVGAVALTYLMAWALCELAGCDMEDDEW